MAHRKALFEFGAQRGMNTYLYAPKDDPYHRTRWTLPYPPKHWQALLQLIKTAQKFKIDFVYGFHPGQSLCFSDEGPVRTLLAKAQRFYDAGVQTFAVLFDDIPSRLEHKKDRESFGHSLARAEGAWLEKIQSQQPVQWKNIEWWICPSYYTPDPLLARTFGDFEPDFLDVLAAYLPANVACMWTGPAVVPETISLGHVKQIVKRVQHRLILWDNFPVNDLSMSDELHIGPLRGRDPRLPDAVYGYLNNPLLQEELSLIPLACCFDYAMRPRRYRGEASWTAVIRVRFGRDALAYWRAIREFCDASRQAKRKGKPLKISSRRRARLREAIAYLNRHRKQKWGQEIRPWLNSMIEAAR